MGVRTAKYIGILLVLTLPFFFPIQVTASPDVGLNVAGPLLNNTYQVVSGQTVEGSLRLKNTGSQDCSFGFTSEITSGPVGSIETEQPNITGLWAPDVEVWSNWTFRICENASGLVIMSISAIATATNQNGSIAQASVSGRVYFLVDPNALSIDFRVVDEYGWPVENVEIELIQGFTPYTRQDTDLNGTTRFVLSANTYRFRAKYHGFLKAETVLNITESTLYTFHIDLDRVKLEQVTTLDVVPVLFWMFCGYIVRALEKRQKRKKSAPKNELEELLEWAGGELS